MARACTCDTPCGTQVPRKVAPLRRAAEQAVEQYGMPPLPARHRRKTTGAREGARIHHDLSAVDRHGRQTRRTLAHDVGMFLIAASARPTSARAQFDLNSQQHDVVLFRFRPTVPFESMTYETLKQISWPQLPIWLPTDRGTSVDRWRRTEPAKDGRPLSHLRALPQPAERIAGKHRQREVHTTAHRRLPRSGFVQPRHRHELHAIAPLG